MQITKLQWGNAVPTNYTGIIEYPNGTNLWYLNGQCHRVDSPAIEHFDGSKEWWVNGERHRIDGPAVEDVDGSKEWWVNNSFILRLKPEDQPFLILQETEDQVKILTTTETKWIKNISSLKQLENMRRITE